MCGWFSCGLRCRCSGVGQFGEDEVVDGFLGEAGESSGLVDVALGCGDLGVAECVLDVSEVYGVGRKRDGREGVAE